MDFAKNWLAQHIKNTDFKYRYKLATRHKTPEPYIWNNEFEVFYKRLDEEHQGLFKIMFSVENNPYDQAKVDELQKLMRDHFYYEEQRYCSVPGYSCVDHKMKHYKFWVILDDLQAPINCEQINWAKNWLAQHIKNTDHGYK